MPEYIYDRVGNAVGFVSNEMIYDMIGHAVGQLNGTHVHTLGGRYVGEYEGNRVVKGSGESPQDIQARKDPGGFGYPGNPGNREKAHGPADAFDELLK
jgi:hypothetical protein